MIQRLVGSRECIRATYYCSTPVPLTSPGQIRFLDYLRGIGVRVVEKKLKKRFDPYLGRARPVEKGADVALAVDLVALAWEDSYDVAILVSGDSDYVSAVNTVMNKGKNVEISSFRDSLSPELRRCGLKTTVIDEMVEQIRR